MQTYQVKTISEFHNLIGIANPEHALVSVINLNGIQPLKSFKNISLTLDFYIISLKRNLQAEQQQYDFNNGLMNFSSPHQIFSIDARNDNNSPGWLLLIQPDFIWKTSLAESIKQYDYFKNAPIKTLFLSEKEEYTIAVIMGLIEKECHRNSDNFSKCLIVAYIELLLQYGYRYYNR